MNKVNNKPMDIIGFYHTNGEYGCFSNWYPAPFESAGIRYATSEHYMMYQKVSMFKQYELAQKILDSTDPAEAKAIGRTRFKEFDRDLWDSLSYTIVKRGVRAKFAQNDELLHKLLSTENSVLMECAPNDRIWGIGMAKNDPDIDHPTKWNGTNKLGKILMEVRSEFALEMALFHADIIQIDAMDAAPIEEWNTRASVLYMHPGYHDAIAAYAHTLPKGSERNRFLEDRTLAGWDASFRNGLPGSIPYTGFYEMKQEVYETAMRDKVSKIHYKKEPAIS